MNALGWPAHEISDNAKEHHLAAWEAAPYATAKQAKAIPDEAYLVAVDALTADPSVSSWATRWDVQDALGAPEKVALAKAKKLIGRGLIVGCGCGCRGDFELTAEGRKVLSS